MGVQCYQSTLEMYKDLSGFFAMMIMVSIVGGKLENWIDWPSVENWMTAVAGPIVKAYFTCQINLFSSFLPHWALGS